MTKRNRAYGSVDRIHNALYAAGSLASPSSAPKPGRADAVERWDAHKTSAGGEMTPPPLTKRCAAAGRGRSMCRADACDRWDSNRTSPGRSSASSSFSSSPSRSRNGSSSSSSPARSSSSTSGASSAERWDINKKPRVQASVLDGLKRSSAAMNMSLTTACAEFAGPSFVSPEPCMLPLPKFLMAR
uniref:Uncharacterized protein n=1 Tax=Leersia perrieri TaxID=77586 RepID=A0A0D9WGX8_9ORYZ